MFYSVTKVSLRFIIPLLLAWCSGISSPLHGQETVCDLFKNLKASDGRHLILKGDLIISKDLAVLGAMACDNQYVSQNSFRPTAVQLRPSSSIPPPQIQQFQEAAARPDALRRDGKSFPASPALSGRLRVAEAGDLPAEFVFDFIEYIDIEELPAPEALPVVSICDLFQNLPAWKEKRIAVRGEASRSSEGSWLNGRCEGKFLTNDYRWPVSLSLAGPAYRSENTDRLLQVKIPADPPKNRDALEGRRNVVESATYVGRVHMRDRYIAYCRGGGNYS